MSGFFIPTAPTRADIERILIHLLALNGIQAAEVVALRAYLTQLEEENRQHREEIERSTAKYPVKRLEAMTVQVQHGSYEKLQPIILVQWTCQECGKHYEREQRPGGIPKYCPPDPDGTPSACQIKARTRAVEKQRLKRQAVRSGQTSEVLRDNDTIANHKPERLLPSSVKQLSEQDLRALQTWHSLGGQGQQYLIEVGLAGDKGKLFRDKRRGKDDRQSIYQKGLVKPKAAGKQAFILTNLGREALLIAPAPAAHYQIPDRAALAHVKELLKDVQPERLTADEARLLDLFFSTDETKNVLSWPRNGVAWKKDKAAIQGLEQHSLIWCVRKDHREIVYQLTVAGRAMQKDRAARQPG